MQVNSYFIETLVLCFSCGCDKGNLNYENIADLSNTSGTCSMDQPGRIVVGKQIHWSDQGGDHCSDGPFEYDLEPIKNIIRLQFNNNPHFGYPPVQPIEPPPYPRPRPRPPVYDPPEPVIYPEEDYDITGPGYVFPVDDCDSLGPGDRFPGDGCDSLGPDDVPDDSVIGPQEPPIDGSDLTGQSGYIFWEPIYHETSWMENKDKKLNDQTNPPPVDESSSSSSSEEVPIIGPSFDNHTIYLPGWYVANGSSYDKESSESSEGSSSVSGTEGIPDVLIMTDNGDFTLKDLDADPTGLAEEKKYWNDQEADRCFYIIVDAQETPSNQWLYDLKELLKKTGCRNNVPPVVFIIDWSKYLDPDFFTTLEKAHLVAKAITNIIDDFLIPIDDLTIIGFGYSAQVAGFTGKRIQEEVEGDKLYKIIALSPAGESFHEKVPPYYKLNKNDAEVVLVLHTETSHLGYCCKIGSVDVLVNDPSIGQPWCYGDEHCSHTAAIDIFLESYAKRPVDVRKKGTGEVLLGFPVEVEASDYGIYYLNTTQDGHPIPYKPGVPDVTVTLDDGDYTFETLKGNLEPVQTFQNEHNVDEGLYIIIDAQETSNSGWTHELKKLLQEHDNPPVIIVDWAKYFGPDFDTNIQNGFYVAEDLTNFINTFKFPVDKITIIGFGYSAHVAGFVGKQIQKENHAMLYKIIALSPAGLAFTKNVPNGYKLTKNDADVVLVIHSDTEKYGYCCKIGSIDVLVNDPSVTQPWCGGDPHCSHESAIKIFMISYEAWPVDTQKEGTGEPLLGFPIEVTTSDYGTYHLNTSQDGSVTPYKPGVPGTAVITDDGSFTIGDLMDHPKSIVDHIKQWNDHDVDVRYYIIIDAQESDDVIWWEELKRLLKVAGGATVVPPVVFVVDWSAYLDPDYKTTTENGHIVAEAVIDIINEFAIPVDKLTIIGFGYSAHVAGFVGNLIRTITGELLYKIIALSPTGQSFTSMVPNEFKLSKDDANVVLVLHLESEKVGYCCKIGSIDVLVNDPSVVQPWCHGDPQCAHKSAIPIFLESYISRPVDVRKETTGEFLLDFPIDVDSHDYGTYYLNTTSDGHPIHIEHRVPDVSISTDSGNFTVGQLHEDPAMIITSIKYWHDHEVDRQFYIIIDAKETTDSGWTKKLKNLIDSGGKDDHPPVVFIIDWTIYLEPNYETTLDNCHLVAEGVTDFLNDFLIPVNKVTIIGFGHSAHVAGFIGKEIQSQNGGLLYKIIALSPTGDFFHPGVPDQDKLTKNDASVVVAIHTETSTLGYCCIGSVDLLVNDPSVNQPWCPTNPQCSHESAILIFLQSFTVQPVDVRKVVTGDILYGFPHEVETSDHGVYHLNTTSDGEVQELPPEMWQIEEYDRMTWSTDFDFSKFPGLDVSKLKLTGQGQGTVSVGNPEKLPLRQASSSVIEFLEEEPLAEIFVLITEYDIGEWAGKVKDALLDAPGPKYVIICDWSEYLYPSYTYTAAHALPIATAITEFLKLNRIPAVLTEIIGFATSAHVAGIVGREYIDSGAHVNRITGLDPHHPLWATSAYRLSETSASIVQVIHTNTRNWGVLEPLGSHDIYMNGGDVQHHCAGSDSMVDLCSHMMAVHYYIESIGKRSIAYQAALQGPIAVKTGNAKIHFGYYLLPHPNVLNKIFVVETNSQKPYLPGDVGFDESPQLPTSPDAPVAFEPNDIYELELIIHYPDRQDIKTLVVQYNGRNPQVGLVISQIINQPNETPTYLLIDGEYGDDMSLVGLENKLLNTVGGSAVIMSVNWSKHKSPSYYEAASKTLGIGKFLATALANIRVPFERLHIIGFSLGAHIAGFLGKEIHDFYDSEVARISGLDPVSALFTHPSVTDSSRLSRGDAHYVDVYHTNALGYGFTDPTGTIDFYLNGGIIQPGCGDDDLCSHYASVLVFTASVDIAALAIEVKYDGEGRLVFLRIPKFVDFGFSQQNSNVGVYYIRSKDEKPYLKEVTSGGNLIELEFSTESPIKTEIIQRKPSQEVYRFPPPEIEVETYTKRYLLEDDGQIRDLPPQ